MKRAAKGFGALAGLLGLIVLGYLGAALITARIGQSVVSNGVVGERRHTIHLVTTLLHADIALPVDERLLTRFPMLAQTDLPFGNPDMKHVLFGWGSQAFYTTAGSYLDVRPGAVLTAVTGDDSVMRVSAAGDLSAIDDVIRLSLSDAQLERLYDGLDQGFALENGQPVPMGEISIGPYDAFFKGRGHFNIFNPCNQWVNRVLSGVGVKLGLWTPTTQSLSQSLVYFGQIQATD